MVLLAYRMAYHKSLGNETNMSTPQTEHSPEMTHLITEPHDGHEPEATCPGCPHQTENDELCARGICGHTDAEHDAIADGLPTESDDLVKRAIRTLLPGLRVANYVERWSPQSPAVRALGILSEYVDQGPIEAGDLIDPQVPTAHPCRPAGMSTPPAGGKS